MISTLTILKEKQKNHYYDNENFSSIFIQWLEKF